MDNLLQKVKEKNRKILRKISISLPSSPLSSARREREQVEQVGDTETTVLNDRIHKWMRESCPPPSPRQKIADCSVNDQEVKSDSVRNWIHETCPATSFVVRRSGEGNFERRRSAPDQRGALQTKSDSCDTLYHPDFADWRACRSLEENSEEVQPAIVFGHDSLSRFFQGSLKAIVP